ncbi:MAG: 50S ribosomal protein L15 [Anaerolineaceae bacterium]|nr:50S ribosomal protein L15 [Anaerolineaceae bacterium]
MQLHDLKPNPGSKKNRKRVGRGHASGHGKTAGRGTKGQNSRSGGGVRPYHMGGNLPFYRKLPFMRGEGFTPINRVEYTVINLEKLATFKANDEVTPDTLMAAKIIRNTRKPVKVLGRGEIKVPLKLQVHKVSESAKAKIEKAGGSIETIAL